MPENGWVQIRGLWPRRHREGQPPPCCSRHAPPHPRTASVSPPSKDAPGSFPRPSSSLPSPKPQAGWPLKKMALPEHFFPYQDPLARPGRRRGGSSHPVGRQHQKAPVIPPQASIFHCMPPARFDSQHSNVWASNI